MAVNTKFSRGASDIRPKPSALMQVFWGLGVVLGYAVIRSFVYASVKPLWMDEVLTDTVCRQANLSGIWQALKHGIDGQPPFFYLIERAATLLIPDEKIGYRFLSICGFACSLIFLYLFVKARNGVAAGLICSSFLLTSALFTFYAAEARPYSLLTACVALALLCYQRAPSTRSVVVMFLALMLACAIHYYAVFLLGPFFLAEATVLYRCKRPRLIVWFALLAAPAPLFPSLPLLFGMKERWGAHFWGNQFTGPGYGAFFEAGRSWSLALAGAAALVVIAELLSSSSEREYIDSASAVAERVLILALILLPVVVSAVAKVTHSSFVSRYFLPSTLGIAAAGGYVLAYAKRGTFILAGAFILIVCAVQEWDFWRSLRQPSPVDRVFALTAAAHREELPVAVSDLTEFISVWHYASPTLRERITGLADPVNSVTYSGSDTTDKIGLALRSYEPIKIQDFNKFAADHHEFLLYSDRSSFDWWPARLLHEGHRLQLLAMDGGNSIYLVQLHPSAPD